DPDFAQHDQVNRELFNEHYTIIRRAWKDSLFHHQGKHWEIPPRGIKWDHPATLHMAPGMVDGQGELDKVGIAPQTLQDPDSIETFIPFTMSAETIEWSAREGLVPIIFSPIPELVQGAIDMYQNAATEAGRNLERGRGLGHFREIVVADTDEEAYAIQERGLGYIWTRWHDWFGFNEALRRPGEEGAIENTPRNIRDRGYSICGSVDTVARCLEQMIEDLNTDLIVPWIAAGPAPIDGLLKSNDLLVGKVLPKIGVELTQYQPKLRSGYDGVGWRNDG
ncbi:MAG: LLM class flavin-dependent oxidoreductase, partial [Gammaproteobacteria bacterium]